MKCNVCGGELKTDSRFCKYCGVPIVANKVTDDLGAELTDNHIELTDEEGNAICFKFLDLISYRGKDYVVLLPEEDETDEVVILQIESLSDESESYVAVESQQILEIVFEIFKERNHDFFRSLISKNGYME